MKAKSLLQPKLLLPAALLIFLFALNSGSNAGRSALQSTYDRWLEQTEAAFRKSEAPQLITPAVGIQVSSGSNGSRFELKLSTTDSPESQEKIFRLLDLIEEGDFFSTTRWEGADDVPGKIALQVVNGDTIFRTHVPYNDPQSDLRIRTVLKLFEIYALERSAAANRVARAGTGQSGAAASER